MKKIEAILLFLLMMSLTNTQKSLAQSKKTFSIMSYNVENLFDTDSSMIYQDNEFTPEGEMKWDKNRYYSKLKRISKVIASVDRYFPALVALVEVENKRVINDLCELPQLSNAKYNNIVSNSDDPRGIDVALLFREDFFSLIKKEEYKIHFPQDENKRTRNILYAELQNDYIGKVNVFVCHYPSRREGQKASEPYRIEVSKVLREKCDSIYDIDKDAKIIIMGDFNDEPQNKSMQMLLKSDNSNLELINLFADISDKNPQGSYFHKGRYSQLDQILISKNILNDTYSSLKYIEKTAQNFAPDFLSDKDKFRNIRKPRRNYLGTFYNNGYSDHFPVIAFFEIVSK